MSRSLATATVVQGNRPSRRALPPGLDPARLPSHVAVIMDGNGRWAGQRKLPRVMGHREGVEALKRTLRLCSDWGIGALTAYAFSTENWTRPGEEGSFLMTLFERVLARELDALDQEQVRIRFLGDLTPLPAALQQLIADATARTAALAAAEQLHFGGDDVNGVALDTRLIGVFAVLQATLYIQGATLFDVFAGDFGQAVIEGDTVPLGVFDHLAGVFVFASAGGGDGDIGHGLA